MSKRGDASGRWREILRRQTESGLSVAAYCRRSKIPQASFYSWRRKLRDAATFTEVQVTPEPSPVADALELISPGGHRIVVRPGFDHVALVAPIDTLDQAATAGPLA